MAEYTAEEKQRIRENANNKTAAYYDAVERREIMNLERKTMTPSSENFYQKSGGETTAAIKGLKAELARSAIENEEYQRLRRNGKRSEKQEARYQELKAGRDNFEHTREVQQSALDKLLKGEELEGEEASQAHNFSVLQAKADWNEAAKNEVKQIDAVDLMHSRAEDRHVNEGTYETIQTEAQDTADLGLNAHIFGPDGIITTDKHYFDAMKEGVQGSFHGETYDELEIRKFKEYGNNYFSLFTYIPGQDEKIPFVADGVMTELPPVSFSTEWANSPAASVGEKLDETLNNDFIEFLGMRAADASTPVMRRKDALTTRVYKDAGEMKFQVKFRIYPGQKIGNRQMTNVKEWLLFLSLTTPINAACSFSVSNTFGNIIKTADGIANAFKELKDYISGDNNTDDVDPNVATVLKAQLGSSTTVDSLYSFQNAAARIANANVFGACVFGLRIYPWIFKQALTVYISDWSVEPSKEWNETVNDHYFYDFTLNCELDQKPSANTWAKEILKDTGF